MSARHHAGTSTRNTRNTTPAGTRYGGASVDGYRPSHAIEEAVASFIAEHGEEPHTGPGLRVTVAFTSFSTVAEVILEPGHEAAASDPGRGPLLAGWNAEPRFVWDDTIVGLVDVGEKVPVVWSEPGVEERVVEALKALGAANPTPTGAEIYAALAPTRVWCDSFDREGSFSLAEQQFGVPYEDIYDAWLAHP